MRRRCIGIFQDIENFTLSCVQDEALASIAQVCVGHKVDGWIVVEDILFELGRPCWRVKIALKTRLV